jgi:hypothetical protein
MNEAARLQLLAIVLRADFAVLCLFGLAMMLMPQTLLTVCGFTGLPEGVHYMLGMWGALMATMGFGYLLAARQPAASQAWVQAGFLRAALEVIVGVYYVSSGAVTIRNAAAGLFFAVWFALFYAVLYPRPQAAREALKGAG